MSRSYSKNGVRLNRYINDFWQTLITPFIFLLKMTLLFFVSVFFVLFTILVCTLYKTDSARGYYMKMTIHLCLLLPYCVKVCELTSKHKRWVDRSIKYRRSCQMTQITLNTDIVNILIQIAFLFKGTCRSTCLFFWQPQVQIVQK